MAAAIVIQAGDTRSVLVPVAGAAGYTGRAVAREWPGGPAVQTWTTQAGSMIIESTGVHLVTVGADSWGWRRAELDVALTSPAGATTVAGPYRVRVRPLISRV